MKKILNTLAAIAVLAVPSLSNAETYALLIGINDYPDAVDSQGNQLKDDDGNPLDFDLKGCVNDVVLMADILQSQYGVDEDNVVVITDGEATEEGFIAGWKQLLEAIKPGDQVIFMYSGHGTQFESEAEPDGFEEGIVLADNTLVDDNFFFEVSRTLAKSGIDGTYIFDSCYSGGISRDPSRREKSLSPWHAQLAIKMAAPASLSGAKATFKAAASEAQGEYAFLLAGREDQPTIDISGIEGIDPHGVFTLFLTAALLDDPEATVEDLVAMTKDVLAELEFEQEPTSEFSSPERAGLPIILSKD